MNPKKLIQAIKDDNRSRQERMFILLVLLGLFGLAIGNISGLILGESFLNILMMSIAFLILLAIVLFTIGTNRIQLGTIIISFLVIYLLLPYTFLTTGVIYGGGPIWFMFGLILSVLL